MASVPFGTKNIPILIQGLPERHPTSRGESGVFSERVSPCTNKMKSFILQISFFYKYLPDLSDF